MRAGAVAAGGPQPGGVAGEQPGTHDVVVPVVLDVGEDGVKEVTVEASLGEAFNAATVAAALGGGSSRRRGTGSRSRPRSERLCGSWVPVQAGIAAAAGIALVARAAPGWRSNRRALGRLVGQRRSTSGRWVCGRGAGGCGPRARRRRVGLHAHGVGEWVCGRSVSR